MKNLKTRFLTLLIALYCSIGVQAQENGRANLKGKVATSSDLGITSDNMDTLPIADLRIAERKGWDGTVKGGKADNTFASKKGYDYYKATNGNAAASVKKESLPANSSERAINECGVSVKSHK